MSNNEEDISDEVLIPLYTEENDNMRNDVKLCPECGREYDSSLDYSKCHGKKLYLAWKCKYCGEDFHKYENSSDIKFCPECGKELTEAQKRIVNAGRSKVYNPNNARYKCKKCGREYKEQAKFCGKCDGELEKLECKCGEPYQKIEDGKYNKYCTVCGNMTTMHPEPPEPHPDPEPPEPFNNGKNGNNGGGIDPKPTIDKKTIIILAVSAAVIILMIIAFFAAKNNSDSSEPIEPQKTILDSGAVKEKYELARDYYYGYNGKTKDKARAAQLYKEAAEHAAEGDKYGISAKLELADMCEKKEATCR